LAQDFQLRLITQRAGGGDPIVRERRAPGPELAVGRAAENDIVLADLSIDPQHAKIRNLGGGRVVVESVSGQGFQSGGRTVQRAELNVAGNPVLGFGSYSLSLEPGTDDTVTIVVTREEPDAAASPSVFSLRAKVFSRRRMAWAFGAGILLICLLVPVFGSGLLRGAKIHPDQQWSSGPLSQAHAFLETDCNACHQKAFVAVRDQACLSCHMKQAPAQQAALDKRLQDLGSPYRTLQVAEHGQAGLPSDEIHKRLRKGWPSDKEGLAAKIQAVFNHPDDRCASCHIEHTTPAGKPGQAVAATPRPEKPTLVVVQTCETCHATLKMRLKDTQLIDTPDWGKHPRFRPMVTRGGRAEAHPPRLALASNPREDNGLIFPHDLHVDPLGGPARQAVALGRARAGASPVTCTSCHDRRGSGFKPVEMEEDCEACHSLAFARGPGGQLAKLPHDEPEKVLAYLNGFYRGAPQAGGIFRAAFAPGGACVDCHTITRNASGFPVVARVHLAQSFMPRGDFNHAIEQHGGKSTDELVCRDCHRSSGLRNDAAAPKWRLSSDAHDLMMPDKAQCDSCHGNAKAAQSDQAGADCQQCHSFHAPSLAACDPDERPLAGFRWTAAEPPRCERKKKPLQAARSG
jgi:hypothetical protein